MAQKVKTMHVPRVLGFHINLHRIVFNYIFYKHSWNEVTDLEPSLPFALHLKSFQVCWKTNNLKMIAEWRHTCLKKLKKIRNIVMFELLAAMSIISMAIEEFWQYSSNKVNEAYLLQITYIFVFFFRQDVHSQRIVFLITCICHR